MLQKAQVFDVKTFDATFSQTTSSTYMFHLNAKHKEQAERRGQARQL